MKRITDIPNISKEMLELYAKIIGLYGNFKAALPLIDAFLEKYPNYHEALIVKAQALMAIGRNSDALRYIKMAKRVDKRRLIGCFDEAEIYLEKKKVGISVETYVNAVRAYAIELKDGIDSYLICCKSEGRDKIKELTRQALTEFFDHNEENKPFEKLHDDLIKMKNEIYEDNG